MPGVVVSIVVGPVVGLLVVVLRNIFLLEVPVAQPEQIFRFSAKIAAGIERGQAEGGVGVHERHLIPLK